MTLVGASTSASFASRLYLTMTDLGIEDGCGVSNGSLCPPPEAAPLDGKESPPPAWLRQLHRDLDVLENAEEGEAAEGGAAKPADAPTAPTLLAALDRTRLIGGRAFLAAAVGGAPLDDVGALLDRQESLRALEAAGLGDPSDETEEHEVRRLAALEPDLLWFFRLREDEALQALCDTAYYGTWPLHLLNTRSPLALAGLNAYKIVVSPWVGLLSPIVYFVVPYIILRWRAGLRIGFVEYLWTLLRSAAAQALGHGAEAAGGFSARFAVWARGASALVSMAIYFHSVLSSFDVARALRRVGGTVAERTRGALEFLELSRARLARHGGARGALACFFPERGSVDEASPLPMSRPPPHPLLQHGATLRDAARFDHPAAARTLRSTYALDALASVLRSKRALGFCWAEYEGEGSAQVRLEGLRHPCLPPTSAVANDWALGAASACGAPNALLTGPNAGGKSTLMKSLLCAVLMAQTLTVAPCRTCRLTPFAMVASHLGVADRAGSASLFQAEMARALGVLSSLSALEAGAHNSKALVVLDEIFSSTNPVEGIAAAAAVARRLAKHPGAISVVSTHYLHLGRLLGRRRYARYGMPVHFEKVGSNLEEHSEGPALLRYPYRLERGLCRQHVALELMRRAGFDAEVLDDAIGIVASLENGAKIPVATLEKNEVPAIAEDPSGI